MASAFDERDHPRGQPRNGGQFRSRAKPAPLPTAAAALRSAAARDAGRAPTMQTEQPVEKLHVATSNRGISWFTTLADANAEADDPRHGGLDMGQPYQRGDVWTEEQRRRLVLSLLQGVPIPSVIVNDRRSAGYVGPDGAADWRYSIVDGKQRVTTVLRWATGDLAVPASWFDPEDVEATVDTDDGPYVTVDGLSRPRRNDMLFMTTIGVCEGRFPSYDEEKRIYELVNRGGTPHTDAEIAASMAT